MKQKDWPEIIGNCIGILAVGLLCFVLVLFVIGVVLGTYAFLAWVVVSVAAGLFGVSLPYWPVVGALFLLMLVGGWMSRNTFLGRR